MADRGTHERLLILAYKKADYSDGSPADQFESFVNPAEVAMTQEIEYDAASGAGTTGSRMEFKRQKPGELSLTFFLDGTGANGRPADVPQLVANFKRVTHYCGDIHRPYYLKLLWGTVPVKDCVLKSAAITYKLFSPDGVPLRAAISASFIENVDDLTRVARSEVTSADLTHRRVVAAGDTLPGLCTSIYGAPGYYLRVARANGLDDPRRITPGMVLHFPPLKKS
ncbi:MAG: hypothetical protein ACOYN0_18165 [Phycisphaerales bacterium]